MTTQSRLISIVEGIPLEPTTAPATAPTPAPGPAASGDPVIRTAERVHEIAAAAGVEYLMDEDHGADGSYVTLSADPGVDFGPVVAALVAEFGPVQNLNHIDTTGSRDDGEGGEIGLDEEYEGILTDDGVVIQIERGSEEFIQVFAAAVS